MQYLEKLSTIPEFSVRMPKNAHSCEANPNARQTALCGEALASREPAMCCSVSRWTVYSCIMCIGLAHHQTTQFLRKMAELACQILHDIAFSTVQSAAKQSAQNLPEPYWPDPPGIPPALTGLEGGEGPAGAVCSFCISDANLICASTCCLCSSCCLACISSWEAFC